MSTNVRTRTTIILLTLVVVALGSSRWVIDTARADITGFGNFSQFTINQNDSGSPPTVPTSGTIELTNGGKEIRSIFATTPQNVSQFNSSFTYQATQIDAFGTNPGAAFVLEDDPRGASAAGNSVNAYGFQGITKSVAITFDLGADSTGLFTNGTISGGSASVSPVNLGSGDPINVQLTYSGSTLTENLLDTVTQAKFSTTYLVLTSIPTTVGGSTAFVGLTAGSSDIGTANEFFSNFQFTTVPEPSSLVLLCIGGTGLLAYLRRKYALSKIDALDHGRILRSHHRHWPVGFLQPRDAVPNNAVE
jgi:hypothetical protein